MAATTLEKLAPFGCGQTPKRLPDVSRFKGKVMTWISKLENKMKVTLTSFQPSPRKAGWTSYIEPLVFKQRKFIPSACQDMAIQ